MKLKGIFGTIGSISICGLMSVSIWGQRRGDPMEALVMKIPEVFDSWHASGPGRYYTRKDIFRYLDGGAELYLSYDFRKLWTRSFVKEGQRPIVLDIFDMGNPADAFGVFSSEREGEDLGIAQGSEYSAGLLRLWKGRFFVSISALEETEESHRAVLMLARIVDGAISDIGDVPDLVRLLPDKGLYQTTIRYFHTYNCLNLYYFLADRNILGLNKKTDAVIASYEGFKLLLVRYPRESLAARSMKALLKLYIPDAEEGKAVELEDGKWVVVGRRGKTLAMILESLNEAEASKAYEGIISRISQ